MATPLVLEYFEQFPDPEEARSRVASEYALGRIAEPEEVATIPINHFDGLRTGKSLRRAAKCVTDVWF